MNIKFTYLLIIFFIFIYFFLINLAMDENDKKKLLCIDCTNKNILVTDEEKQKIEHVIKNYNKNKDLNISRISEIKSDMYNGFLSGMLVGFISGLPIDGIITSGLVYSTVSGTIKSNILLNESNEFLINDRYI